MSGKAGTEGTDFAAMLADLQNHKVNALPDPVKVRDANEEAIASLSHRQNQVENGLMEIIQLLKASQNTPQIFAQTADPSVHTGPGPEDVGDNGRRYGPPSAGVSIIPTHMQRVFPYELKDGKGNVKGINANISIELVPSNTQTYRNSAMFTPGQITNLARMARANPTEFLRNIEIAAEAAVPYQYKKGK